MNNYTIGDKLLCHLREADNLASGRYQPFVSCEIDPSNRCQLDCKWCFFKKYRKNNLHDLDMDTYNRTVTQLYGAGCESITFTGGGEPLVHPQIRQMIDFAYIHNMKLGLVTNGIYLHKIIDKLHRFSFVRVSLDCSDRQNYAYLKGGDFFDQICDNILVATKASCDVGISMVHMPGTSKEKLDQFTELGKALGVDYVQIKASWQPKGIEGQTDSMQNSDAFVTERYTVRDHLPCMMAGLCGSVAANGRLYYCCIHRGDPRFEVWNLNLPFNLKRAIEYRSTMQPDIGTCGSCRYANFARAYEKARDKKFTMLRHREFV